MSLERKIAWASLFGTPALGLLVWGLAQAEFHWPWQIVYGAIVLGGTGLIVTAVLWCHIGWTFFRRKGLQMGPAIIIALGLSIVAGGIIWGAFTWQSNSHNDGSQDAFAIAQLTELGWSVQPGPDGAQFEIANKALPSMEESAKYFRQLSKPFKLHFQSIPGLQGMHYLADVANCSKIEINAGDFSDISELRAFTHLNSLLISQVPLNIYAIVDGEVLGTLTDLTELHLGMTKVRTLGSLAALRQLKKLSLDGTLVSDLSPLSGLGALESLTIRDAPATDLISLSHISTLTELEISASQIPGVTVLSQLKVLRIIDQGRVDLSPVAALTHLEKLSVMMGVEPLDLSPLRKLTNLRTLSLMGFGGIRTWDAIAPLTDIDALRTLSQLEKLSLVRVEIKDLGFVTSLKNLNEVTLNFTPIESVGALSGNTMLHKIWLDYTLVSDISPLFALPNLTNLSVDHSPVRSDQLAELERRRGVKIGR